VHTIKTLNKQGKLMKRVLKETSAQMRSDFNEWAAEWLGYIFYVILAIAAVITSVIIMVIAAVAFGIPSGGILLILVIQVITEILLIRWAAASYSKAKEKINKENKDLLNMVDNARKTKSADRYR